MTITLALILAAVVYLLWWLLTLPLRTWYAYLIVMALDHGDEMPYEVKGLWSLWCNEDWPKAKAYILTRALLLDVMLNATWGCVLCRDFTLRDRLLTQRMQRYLRSAPTTELDVWRRRVAVHVCRRLLDPYARGRCHC